MLDFACKRFDIWEVIKCSLGLTRSEVLIFKFFLNNKEKKFSTKDIAKNLELDLSTIQRAVKILHGHELIRRSQVNLSSGGYSFLYSFENKEGFRKKIMRIIDNWKGNVDGELKKL